MNFVSGIERHMECQFLFGCTHLEIHCLIPQSPLQHQQRGRARPRRRPGGARPRWRSPAMGELDPPVMEERASMTARAGWGQARSQPGHGGARPRMEEPDLGGNRPRRSWESSSLEPASHSCSLSIDKSTNGGKARNYITIDSCRRNPHVELTTINKVLPGDIPDYLKIKKI